jgi:hypothetical protein
MGKKWLGVLLLIASVIVLNVSNIRTVVKITVPNTTFLWGLGFIILIFFNDEGERVKDCLAWLFGGSLAIGLLGDRNPLNFVAAGIALAIDITKRMPSLQGFGNAPEWVMTFIIFALLLVGDLSSMFRKK